MKKTFSTNGRLLSQVFSSYNDTFDALCELINNSIQAKSKEIKIEVDLVDDDAPSPDPFTEYRIIDDGDGVSQSEFDKKILEIATDAKDGKGIGRFSAFQIGSTVIINTTAYDNFTRKYTNSSVTLDAKLLTKEDISKYNIDFISTEVEIKSKKTFYKIIIKDFWDEAEKEKYPKKKLSSKLIPGNLEEAIFLKYSSYIVTEKIAFFTNNKKIAKEDFLLGEPENKNFIFTFSDDSTEQVSLEFVNYKGKKKKIILSYMVENNGIKTSAYEDDMNLDYPEDNSWVVYIDCDYFNSKADIFRNLSLDGLDEDLANLKKQVKNTVREFIKNKHKDYYLFVEKLENDKYYPYQSSSQPSTTIYTFNHLAYFIEEDYSLLRNNVDTRKIIYPLLDKAMSNGDILGILESIISLDDEKIKLFKELLGKSDLSEVIKFTSEVANKQRFLDFLHEIIYGNIGKYLKERKQLHKIVEKHLWLFGEEYSDTPVFFSDKSLKNSLDELHKKYFEYKLSKDDDNLIEIKQKEIADIADLIIYNDKRLPNDKHEIMIVELKSPKVKISQKELNQVIRYKHDIETLAKFSKSNTKYKIILVSSDISSLGKSAFNKNDGWPPTLFIRSDNPDIEIHVMVWSDIISDIRQHLKYLSNYLETKDVDVKQEFKNQYPELDISNLKIPIKKDNK